MLDGTSRARALGTDLGLMTRLGTFAGHNVVGEQSLVKIDEDIPLDRACLVGCGVSTGWGAAVNTARVEQGDVVVVIGCGGIGCAAIQGARLAGAEHIVAVDVVADRRSEVERYGATAFASSIDEARATVAELTRGVMADASLLTVGVVTGDLIGPALSLVRKGGTTVVTSGSAWTGTTAELSLLDLVLSHKAMRGSLNHTNPRHDIPRLLRLYRSGDLLLDEMITRRYAPAEINAGYADMLAGRNVRGVLMHDHATD